MLPSWLCRFHSCYSRTNLADSAAHFACIPGGWKSRGDARCVDDEEHQQDSHDRSQSLKPHIGRHCVTIGDRSRRPAGHTGATIGLQFYYVHQTERPPRTTRARGDVPFTYLLAPVAGPPCPDKNEEPCDSGATTIKFTVNPSLGPSVSTEPTFIVGDVPKTAEPASLILFAFGALELAGCKWFRTRIPVHMLSS